VKECSDPCHQLSATDSHMLFFICSKYIELPDISYKKDESIYMCQWEPRATALLFKNNVKMGTGRK
jgi:hypothetical protein